ncbi:MAG: NifU family protein [Candidatus Acidulodesulfobacterium ferriphilum]|jgi:Thioredoxin-like proteins and domains|uniref:NifU family protein n=1 Tax=Candidatus Acidulodesulfobacterium ferriphilum TaxID=2597223 RepID=A0A519B940_9DELT|nr:NifU family protein [Deltaproteobacteria bacterium]MDA8053732.1 NifU family protein [Deltaproteobacteria bacterium]MDA8272642.1 NifU family protein [Deltaproteobacteria bacterium]RZD13820.1 MAG: NifU family protein [Candidatus Acidulodesulfobacterium ferriphilum]
MALDRVQVTKVLDEIRPSLQFDGGDVELVNILDDGTVNVRLKGACAGCMGSIMTLKGGIERLLKERVPGVKEVNAV